MTIIDGKKIAEGILERLRAGSFDALRTSKFLAAVLVGDDPASSSFLKQKEKAAQSLGIDFRLYRFPDEISKDGLREEVLKIASHKTCGGVIVQLPLPNKLDAQYVLNAIPREKDVDVLGERALGAFYAGRNPVLPPAVGVVSEIIENYKLKIENSMIAVVGRGLLVGRPIAVWLMGKAKELIVFGRDGDLSLLKNADIVISGVGKAGLVKPEMLKPAPQNGGAVAGHGTLVIDFGYDGGKGDFDNSQLEIGNWKLEIGWYTPTPGGTGPILVAKLMENFFVLNNETKK